MPDTPSLADAGAAVSAPGDERHEGRRDLEPRPDDPLRLTTDDLSTWNPDRREDAHVVVP